MSTKLQDNLAHVINSLGVDISQPLSIFNHKQGRRVYEDDMFRGNLFFVSKNLYSGNFLTRLYHFYWCWLNTLYLESSTNCKKESQERPEHELHKYLIKVRKLY